MTNTTPAIQRPSVLLAEAVRLLRAAGHPNRGNFGTEADRLLLADEIQKLIAKAQELEK